MIADVTLPAKRARALGLVGVAIGLSFIIGPGAGSWPAASEVNLQMLARYDERISLADCPADER